MSSPQRLHGERSSSQRRRLAKSMASPRQLVESKGALQSVPKCASENLLNRFRKNHEALHQKHSFVPAFLIFRILAIDNDEQVGYHRFLIVAK